VSGFPAGRESVSAASIGEVRAGVVDDVHEATEAQPFEGAAVGGLERPPGFPEAVTGGEDFQD
jgi:hypothetical protein